MPKELPSYVKVIFSCLPDEKFQVLDAARKHWGKDENNLLEIDQLPVRFTSPSIENVGTVHLSERMI